MTDWDAAGLFAGLDAYTDWAMGPGRHYVGALDRDDRYVPVIVELDKRYTPDQFHEEAYAAVGTGRSGLPCVCLPPWYRQTGGGDEPYRLSVLLTRELLAALPEHSRLRKMITQLVIGQPLSPGAVNHASHGGAGHAAPTEGERPAPEGDPEEGTVIVGVIDDAIAFTHERFRWSDGTSRVEYAWVQDLDGAPPHASTAVPYGREWSKYGINRLLRDHTRGDHTRGTILDEDRLYRRAGLTDFSRPGPKAAAWRVSHGTHVMDLACGYAPDKAEENRAEGQDRPIVCVQLPAAVTADTSGAGLAPYVLDGIQYILERADRIAVARGCGPLPVVINFSYGFIAGPHDGTHPIELAIDEIVETRRAKAPVSVVLPAGNSHLARCHAEVRFQKEGEEVTLDWRILPDDRTSTFLEIWLPPGKEGQSRVAVSVAPPGHGFSQELAEGAADSQQALTWPPNAKDPACKLSYELVPASGRGRFVVAVLPTAFHDAPTELAPSGLWRVKLTNKQPMHETVHLWIQRDDTPHGYPVRGRQSFFEGARSCFDGRCRELPYKRFDEQGRVVVEDDGESPVRRAGSISAIATGGETVVVGGLVRKKDGTEDPLARYSSGGPVTPPASGEGLHRQGPDAVAVCDDSEVHWGVLAAGSRSGSVVAMNGTSVAAPQVARWIADQFADSAAGGPGKALAITTPEGAVHARATGLIRRPGPVPQGSPPPAFAREGAGFLSLPPIVPLDRYEP